MSKLQSSRFDANAGAVYFTLEPLIENGAAVEQYIIDRDTGRICLDFDKKATLVDVEVIGARKLRSRRTIAVAKKC